MFIAHFEDLSRGGSTDIRISVDEFPNRDNPKQLIEELYAEQIADTVWASVELSNDSKLATLELGDSVIYATDNKTLILAKMVEFFS